MEMVAVPTVRGVNRLMTYGTLEIGEVPRLALMEKATPKAMIASPASRMTIRFKIEDDSWFFKMLIPFSKKYGAIMARGLGKGKNKLPFFYYYITGKGNVNWGDRFEGTGGKRGSTDDIIKSTGKGKEKKQ